jgi:hypothetical protein
MFGSETAALPLRRHQGPFVALAHGSGFTERQCALAAETGRLPDVIRVYQLRRRQHRGATSAAEIRLRLLELRARMVD